MKTLSPPTTIQTTSRRRLWPELRSIPPDAGRLALELRVARQRLAEQEGMTAELRYRCEVLEQRLKREQVDGSETEHDLRTLLRWALDRAGETDRL
jgi:hypothetical protein